MRPTSSAAFATRRWHEAAGTPDDRVAVEQHCDGGDENEERGAETAEEPGRQLADRIGVEPGRQVVDEFLRLPGRIVLLQAIADQRPAVELLDRRGHLLGERARLIDRLRTEQQHDAAEHQRQGDGDDQRCRGAAAPQPTPEHADHRVEGEAEQHAQHEGGEHVLRRTDQRDDRHRQQHAAGDEPGRDGVDAHERGVGDIPVVGHGAVQYRRWPTPLRAGRPGRRPSANRRSARRGACWSPPRRSS